MKFTDTVSHSEISLLGTFCMYQENDASFMEKVYIFHFFHRYFWDTLIKNTDLLEKRYKQRLIINNFFINETTMSST